MRSNPFNLGGIQSAFKNILSKDLLLTGAGAVAGTSAVSYVALQFGDKLPLLKRADGSRNVWGEIAWTIAITATGSWLASRVNRKFAEGVALSGVILTIKGVADAFNINLAPGTGTGEYFPSRALETGLSAAPRSITPPGYSAIRAFGASPFQAQSAFRNNAFAN